MNERPVSAMSHKKNPIKNHSLWSGLHESTKMSQESRGSSQLEEGEGEREEDASNGDEESVKKVKFESVGTRATQAIEALRLRSDNTAKSFPGFFYQMQITVLIWSCLEREQLFVELGEDITIAAIKAGVVEVELAQLKAMYRKKKVCSPFRVLIGSSFVSTGKSIDCGQQDPRSMDECCAKCESKFWK